MLIFIVPIKSAKLASDWSEFSKLVERTLKSICNQDSQNFKVVIACHELPDISYENDKIEYVQVTFDPPKLIQNEKKKNRELKEADKAKKVLVAYEKAKSYNPDYVMVVDSDDLIINSIVSFVEKQNNNCPGWYFPQGYFYQEGSKYLFINKENFNIKCGTCIVIKTELFPQLITNDPWLYYFHETMVLPDGKPLKKFNFKGALYSMANGENHLMSAESVKEGATSQGVSGENFLNNIFRKMKKYSVRPITRNFKRKFSFYKI